MYKLYLLVDEWDNDINFVGYELNELMKTYEVTLICNSATVPYRVNGDFVVYRKPGRFTAAFTMLKGLFDKEAAGEIRKVIAGKTNVPARISEILHFYANARMFRSFMEKNGYLEDGVIYYSYWYFWKCFAITGIIDRFPNSGVITRTHGYDLYDDVRPSGYQPFKEAMDKKLSKVVFISEFGMDYYLNRYKVKDEKKYVLSCLGTKDHGGPVPYKRAGDLNLVSCSHINSVKRVHLIVKALGLIDDIKIKWTHFGDGDKADEIKELAGRLLDNKANIEYEFAGQVDNADIHDYYGLNRVDALILASESEGNPVSVMEAMSYGIPIIAPGICNLPVMIGDGGMLTSPECDPSELADLIRKLHDLSDDEVNNMRKAARLKWEEKFDAEKNSRVFIEEVLGGL